MPSTVAKNGIEAFVNEFSEAGLGKRDNGHPPMQPGRGMLDALGADITEGKGSRVRVHLNGVRATFHRPHPGKEACKGAVEAVRDFLANAGAAP